MRLRHLTALLISLVIWPCSCSEKNPTEVPGPWRLSSVALKNYAPPDGGTVAVTVFSVNKKPRYLWVTLTFEEEPLDLYLERFTILDASGDSICGISFSIRYSANDITLVFVRENGWDTKAKLTLSDMSHQVPFTTPKEIEKWQL